MNTSREHLCFTFLCQLFGSWTYDKLKVGKFTKRVGYAPN